MKNIVQININFLLQISFSNIAFPILQYHELSWFHELEENKRQYDVRGVCEGTNKICIYWHFFQCVIKKNLLGEGFKYLVEPVPVPVPVFF